MNNRIEFNYPEDFDPERFPTPEEALEVLENQGYCCYLTGDLLTEDSCQVDQFNPWQPLTKDNMVFVSENIRAMRGKMTVDTFLAFITKVLAFTYGCHEFESDSDRKIYNENMALLFGEYLYDQDESNNPSGGEDEDSNDYDTGNDIG